MILEILHATECSGYKKRKEESGKFQKYIFDINNKNFQLISFINPKII